MNISMSMIESYLGSYNTESNIQDDALTIHGMRFISEGSQRSSREYVYIGQALDYLKDTSYADALILANGKNHIVCRGSDYEELLNEVLSAFDFYNRIDGCLLKAAAAARPIAEMIDTLGETTDDPFLAFGIDGSLLAAVNLDKLPVQALRTSIDERGSLGALSIGMYFVDETGAVQHDLTDEARATYGPDGEMAVSRYFSLEGERVGFVMCFPLSKASARLAVCLESAYAPYLAQAREFTAATSPHQSQHLALASLIEGASVTDEICDKIIGAIGANADFHLVLAHSLAIRNRTQRLLLAGEIEASPTPCLSCEQGEDVAFLVTQGHLDDLIAQVQQRFDAKSVAIGVSMPMSDVRQAPRAYRQASFACEALGGAGVRYCSDLALPFFLQVLDAEPATHDLIHPALARLAAYDQETGSDMLATLNAYVNTGCNQVECARALHVHLNTLKYRLKRIVELCGIDFKDQNELFYLMLSIKLAG